MENGIGNGIEGSDPPPTDLSATGSYECIEFQPIISNATPRARKREISLSLFRHDTFQTLSTVFLIPADLLHFFFLFLVFNISSFRMWTLFFCFLGRWVMSYFQLSMFLAFRPYPSFPKSLFSVSLFHIPKAHYFIYKFTLLLLFQLYLHPSNNNSTSVSNVQSFNVTFLRVTFSPQWIKTPK